MPHRITYTIEIYLAGLTMFSTMISGSFFIDLILAVVTYMSARLFYYYFGNKIKWLINNIKLRLKKK